MKRLQFAISQIILYIPLWLLLWISIVYSYNFRNELIQLESGLTIHCGQLVDNNYTITNNNAKVLILDNKTQTPITMFINNDKIVKGYDICGYDYDLERNIHNKNVKYGFLLFATFIMLCFACSILSVIFLKNYNV